MLSKKINDLLNEQANKELTNSTIYQTMRNYAENKGLTGIAKYFKKEAKGEHEHHLQFIHYIFDRSGVYEALPVNGFDVTKGEDVLKTVKSIFKQAYTVEMETEKAINDLYFTALADKDAYTCKWLKAIITEQMYDSREAKEVLDKVNRVTTTDGLNQFDEEI